MLPIYLIIGFMNIFAKTSNYGINIKDLDPTMDIRVRRDVQYTPNINENIRVKRQFSFFGSRKIVITTPKPLIPRYNYSGKLDYSFATQQNGFLHSDRGIKSNFTWTPRSYNSSRPFSSTGFYNPYNRTGFGGGISFSNSTYYGFPGRRINATSAFPTKYTLMPRFNATGFGYGSFYPGYNYTQYTTPKYGSGSPGPLIYNYQDPTKSNFSGYFEHISKAGNITTGFNSTYKYNTTIKPYAPGYDPIPVFNGVKSNSTTHWYNSFTTSPVTPKTGTTGIGTAKPGHGVRKNGTVTTTTERILSGCVICNIGCPAGQHRAGLKCVKNDYDYEY